jgi:hypothetical protein
MANIIDINDAVREVCKEIHQYPSKIIDINNGRYKIVKVGNNKILVIFKREKYLSFGRIKEGEGWGETINSDSIDICKREGIESVYIAYKDGTIYRTTIEDIIRNGINRITDAEGKEVISFALRPNLVRV